MNKPIKLTNEQMRPGHEVEQHLREHGHLPDTGCCGLETNFIEEQQREWDEGYQQMHKSPTVEQWLWLETNVEATITNTLNHILESGLLEEKEELMPSEYLSGKQHGHNTLARAVKEFMSNMDKV